MKIKLLIATGFIMLITQACVNRFDSDIQDYLAFREHAAQAEQSFSKLSEQEKLNIFFGSIKIHPPSSEIGSIIAKGPSSFVFVLRKEIEIRNVPNAGNEFIRIIFQMKRNNTITDEQIDTLNLEGICNDSSQIREQCRQNIRTLFGSDAK